jgi:hypothetical protein
MNIGRGLEEDCMGRRREEWKEEERKIDQKEREGREEYSIIYNIMYV